MLERILAHKHSLFSNEVILPLHFDILDVAGERKELFNVSVRDIWRNVADLDRLYLQNIEEHD